MPIWATAPVSESPSLELCRWRILETDKSERHFVGYNLTDCEGRVSSAIERFDRENLTGRTRSGRVYRLIGAPGFDADATYVWHGWCAINGVKRWDDVTEKSLAGQ